MLPLKFRRGLSLAIPVFSAILFFGLFNDSININTNVFSTGVTVGIIMGFLNIFLIWLSYRHEVP